MQLALRKMRTVPLAVALMAAPPPIMAAPACQSPSIQVLGSGGPDASDARASSGFVLWLDGEARLLVNAGGGVFLRFGEAQAKFESLDAIAITHLHSDHVADLAAILKSGFFSDRERPLPIVGPSGNEAFPSIEFVRSLFDARTGSFRYLAGYLDGSGGLVKLEVENVEFTAAEPQTVFANARFKVMAVGVKHGSVPALGYVIQVGETRVAISGDQNGDNAAFASLAAKSDILIMDHAIPENAGEVERSLHARPSEIGDLANKIATSHLVLSHNMSRSLDTLDQDLAEIQRRYKGRITLAADLMCLELNKE